MADQTRDAAATYVAALSPTELKAFLRESRPQEYDGRERGRAEAQRRFGEQGGAK